MTVTISHTHEDGTLVYGTSKGDGTAAILKANRFRWFPSIKLWGVPQSRDHLAKRWQINAAAEAMRAAGFEVEVEVDDTPRDVAEVREDRAERLDARYDRLTAKAERNMTEAEARSSRAHEISERFAFGQPILVGHHSEHRARADHKRMDGHQRAANAAYAKAEHAQQAASVVGSADAYRDRPAVIIRRIEKTEAELRKVQHHIDGTRPANDWRGAYYAPESKPASGAWLESLEARKAFYEHQLAADREALAEHERNGYVRHSAATIHKGDVITSSHWWDTPGKVVRVNPKTVTVESRPGDWCPTRKVPYETVKTVQCPHEGTTTMQAKPAKVEAKPAPDSGVTERLAEFKASGRDEKIELLAVSAGTECFTTPPAVTAAMIEAAELEPGMTVLEPSAGTGAIARPVAELGATVTCIELDYNLYQRLSGDERNGVHADGLYRSVQHGDFLEADPSDGPLYDRVLMNPPFARQADIRHVTHALRFVEPGGLLVAVMSAGVEFRQDKTAEAFRKLVAGSGGWIERLPDDAFEASGTSVRTVMAVIPVEGAAS